MTEYSPENPDRSTGAWDSATGRALTKAELAERHAEALVAGREWADNLDITDRALWEGALDMAASEGALGPFVGGDPYRIRDRMMAYFDELQARPARDD